MAADLAPWSETRLEADFVRDRVIGRGRYGQAVLWHARKPRAGEASSVVVKQVVLEALSEKEREQTTNEVALLATLQHPNVIGYLGAFVDKRSSMMNIVLEYADDGTLADRIKQCALSKRKLEPSLVQRWFAQLALAIDHVHASRILHRDVKSANIFLTSTKDIKLGDFGVSRQLSETGSMATTVCGTPYYLAPELVRGEPYSQPADIWALGCVLFEMITLHRPFTGGNIGELVMNISRGRFTRGDGAVEAGEVSLLEASTDDVELRALVLGMLRLDADERLSLEQVLGSRYVQDALDEAALPLFASTAHASASVEVGQLQVQGRGGDGGGSMPPPESPRGSSVGSSQPVASPQPSATLILSSPRGQHEVNRALARETSLQSDASSAGMLSPSPMRSGVPPSPTMLAQFGLGRNGSPADLLTFRDSVSDAARRARRRRGAIGSPSARAHVPALARHSSSSTSIYSTHVTRSPAVGRRSTLGSGIRGTSSVPNNLQQLSLANDNASSGESGIAGCGEGVLTSPPTALRTRSVLAEARSQALPGRTLRAARCSEGCLLNH